MGIAGLPLEWQDAFRRDLAEKPSMADPLPERKLARLLAAFIAAGLFFMTLPGTVLGVWNLVGISSQRQLAGVSAAWIQAHGHAQFFGWVGTFIIGISIYTLPKFRGGTCRSIPLAWWMWAMWNTGVGLRWLAGIQSRPHRWEFTVAALLAFTVAALLFWQLTPVGKKYRKGQPWEAPVFAGFGALLLVLGWQFVLAAGPLTSPALPAESDKILISLAVWTFTFPVVAGYCAKFFPGLLGTAPSSKNGIRTALVFAGIAAIGFAFDLPVVSAAGALLAALSAAWALRVFHPKVAIPKTSGVYQRYPEFARLAYIWLIVSACLGFGVPRAGMLGASRHAFTVGFLATLIFSLGPRILPAFLNGRELWSKRLMRVSLLLITAGCALRVISEPLAYGEIVPAAWKVLPVSAFTELTAVLFFACNLAMTMVRTVPCWFGREQVNDRMSLYWLVSSYPATRRLLVDTGIATLAAAKSIPKSLSLQDAARADGVSPAILVEKLGDFFESRLAPSLRK